MFFRKDILVFAFLIFIKIFIYSESYHELAVCAIFQNEAPYLKEWIEFHKLVGVSKFYLYNNLSQDNYQTVLQPYIETEEVTLTEWNFNTNYDGSNWPTIQTMAYNHAINNSKGKVKWLAIIDTDEFLFPVEKYSLIEFLQDFEDFASIAVNWQLFGTSFVKKINENELMIEKLIYKANTNYLENTHIKSIVRPEFVEYCLNPHFCILKKGYCQVDTNKQPCYGPFNNILIDKLRINHYWTRDEYFFYHVKFQRRALWQDQYIFEKARVLNKEGDLSIYKYLPELKKRIIAVN